MTGKVWYGMAWCNMAWHEIGIQGLRLRNIFTLPYSSHRQVQVLEQ